MLKLYTWTTPNGYKPAIMLEELDVPYELILIDLPNRKQKTPAYLKLNPVGKIPTLVDGKIVVFESVAILLYLAEKYTKKNNKKAGTLLPKSGPKRYEVLEWLMFQMEVAHMFGQATHFKKHAPKKVPYAIERYDAEAKRILDVLEKKLKKTEYLAGVYSIADIATWPWVRSYKNYFDFKKYPGISKWYKRMDEKPTTGTAIHKITTARGEKK